MEVIRVIGDMSCNSSLAYYRPTNELVAEKLGGFQSARIILHSLAFDETELNDMLRVLPGREQK